MHLGVLFMLRLFGSPVPTRVPCAGQHGGCVGAVRGAACSVNLYVYQPYLQATRDARYRITEYHVPGTRRVYTAVESVVVCHRVTV